jgi:hypothetical protein
VEAKDREELERAMAVTVEVPFEVLRGDEIVGTGVVNGEELSLVPGAYRVRVLGGGAPAERDVEVTAGETSTLPLS